MALCHYMNTMMVVSKLINVACIEGSWLVLEARLGICIIRPISPANVFVFFGIMLSLMPMYYYCGSLVKCYGFMDI